MKNNEFPQTEKETKTTLSIKYKILIVVSLISLVALVLVISFSTSLFKNSYGFLSYLANTNVPSLEMTNPSADPLVTIVPSGEIKSPAVNPEDPVRGSNNPQVEIIEFGDFQSPTCALMQINLRSLLNFYEDKVKIVWKDLPIKTLHEEAERAAEAARCAQEQDKFWEMHDQLFNRQNELSLELYKKIAQEIGLNLKKFEDCFDSHRFLERVNLGLQEGIEAGVDAVPYFFINQKPISGFISIDDLKRIVEEELAE